VTVNGKGLIVPYDQLVLCTGLQYQIPEPTGLDVNAAATNHDLSQPADAVQPPLLTAAPSNVFVVNDVYEAAVLLYWLEDNVLGLEGLSVCLSVSVCLSNETMMDDESGEQVEDELESVISSGK